MRAHYKVRYLKTELYHEIAKKLIERYRTTCNAIKFTEYDNIKFVHEVSTMLDIFNAYNIVSYRYGINE